MINNSRLINVQLVKKKKKKKKAIKAAKQGVAQLNNNHGFKNVKPLRSISHEQL